MEKLIALLILIWVVLAKAGPIQSQCDSVAATTAQLYVRNQLMAEGVTTPYPGPEVTNFEVLDPESEYRVSVGGPRPSVVRVQTAQKSYYCAVRGAQLEQ
jgi:hypothetical protein